jgi:hypothetical protein
MNEKGRERVEKKIGTENRDSAHFSRPLNRIQNTGVKDSRIQGFEGNFGDRIALRDALYGALQDKYGVGSRE